VLKILVKVMIIIVIRRSSFFLDRCAFRVDHGRKWSFELKCDHVYDVHIRCDEQASWLFVPKGGGSKTHGASDVHWVFQHVEWETLHSIIHQNPKVIAKECTSYAEGPGRSDNECLAEDEQGSWDDNVIRFGKDWNAGLVC